MTHDLRGLSHYTDYTRHRSRVVWEERSGGVSDAMALPLMGLSGSPQGPPPGFLLGHLDAESPEGTR